MRLRRGRRGCNPPAMDAATSRLELYLARIGLSAPPPADAAGLAALQIAQRKAIPFENLDIMLGRGISGESDAVFAKLVRQRRGGYCFEQNRLFSDMLQDIGTPHRMLMARVLLGDPEEMPPLTHCLLLADLGGEPWIADAGFGGSWIPPMQLADGSMAETTDGARHRLRRIGAAGSAPGEWLLERAGPGGDWQRQYAFGLNEVTAADLAMGNHWTSTHGESRFTSLHIASIVLEDGFVSLVDRQLVRTQRGTSERREIADAEDYAETLRGLLRLDLPQEELARLPLFA